MNNKLTVTTRFSPDLIEQTLDLGTDDLVASKARQVVQLQDQGIRDALVALGWLAPDEATELRQQLDQIYTFTPDAELKAALSGEFSFQVSRQCSACCFDAPDEDCEVCGGDVEYTESVTVPWTKIKGIIRAFCEHQAQRLRGEVDDASSNE